MSSLNLVTCAFVWEKVKLLAIRPIEAKLHMEPLWDKGTEVYLNGPGHMTKMAAMPMYGQNHSKIFFSRTSGPIALKVGM